MDITEVKAAFEKHLAELKETVKKRDEEIKALGEAREETGQKMTALEEQLGKISDDYKGMLEKFETHREELNKTILKGNRPGVSGEEVKSIGEQFTSSDAYKAMLDSNGFKSNSVKIEGWTDLRAGQKALTTGEGSASALINPFRVPGVFARPNRQPRLRDLMVTNTTDESSVEFVEEAGFYQLYAELTAGVAAAATTLPLDNAHGFFPGQAIEVGTGTANAEKRVVDTVDLAAGEITITVGLTNGHAADAAVTSDTFVFTPETQLKPRSDASFVLQQEAMRTLAHWIPASRQVLKNRAMLRQHIDSRLLEGLALSEERQILYGNGATDQLQGILTNSRIQTYAWSNGAVGDSKIDAVRRALTLAQLAHYPVDGVVINPIDWEDIELAKGSDGHYIWVQVTEGGQTRLWRAPVVVTTAIDPGDFLVGAFSMGAALWDRENPTIRVAENHADFFIKNMVAILAEQELALTTYRPESFIHGEFDAAPA